MGGPDGGGKARTSTALRRQHPEPRLSSTSCPEKPPNPQVPDQGGSEAAQRGVPRPYPVKTGLEPL